MLQRVLPQAEILQGVVLDVAAVLEDNLLEHRAALEVREAHAGNAGVLSENLLDVEFGVFGRQEVVVTERFARVHKLEARAVAEEPKKINFQKLPEEIFIYSYLPFRRAAIVAECLNSFGIDLIEHHVDPPPELLLLAAEIIYFQETML